MRNNTKEMTLAGLTSALLAVVGPLTLPLGPIPLSLISFILMLTVYLLPLKSAVFSVLIYLLLGIMGLPVFSGFTGGLGKLAGPTGGYLIGYLLMLPPAALAVKRSKGKIRLFFGLFAAHLALYVPGTIWLAFQMELTPAAAFSAGVLPFLPGDLLKVLLAVKTGPVLKKRLRRREG